MKTKYYQLKIDLSEKLQTWQLKKDNIYEDVGTNMFVAVGLLAAIKGSWQQIDPMTEGIIRSLIDKKDFIIEL